MKNYLLLIILFLFLGSCKKTTSSTPVDAFTCTINGSNFAASNTTAIHMSAELLDSNYYLDLNATDVTRTISIVLYDPATIGTRTYNITDSFGTTHTCTAKYTNVVADPYHGYTTGGSYTGTLTLQVDKNSQRVSGTFSFRGKFQTSTDTANITNGSFSLPCVIH